MFCLYIQMFGFLCSGQWKDQQTSIRWPIRVSLTFLYLSLCRYECDVISDAGGPPARPRWPSSAQQLPFSAHPLSRWKLRLPTHLSADQEVRLQTGESSWHVCCRSQTATDATSSQNTPNGRKSSRCTHDYFISPHTNTRCCDVSAGQRSEERSKEPEGQS